MKGSGREAAATAVTPAVTAAEMAAVGAMSSSPSSLSFLCFFFLLFLLSLRTLMANPDITMVTKQMVPHTTRAIARCGSLGGPDSPDSNLKEKFAKSMACCTNYPFLLANLIENMGEKQT